MVEPLPVLADNLPAGYALAITQALYFAVAFAAVWLVGRLAVRPLAERAMDRRDLDLHARKPLSRLLTLLIGFVAVAVAFGFAGFGSFLTSLATIAAAATLAVGFAMQDVIANFVAGVFIFTERPFRIGDWIEWDDYSGIVEDISLRVTRVRTFDNELLTVPNSHVTDGVIKNPVAKDRLRLKFLFGIGYDDDVAEATSLILEAAEAHDEILAEPAPAVRLTELGDSAVGLQSRIWIADPSRADFVRIRSEFVEDVKARFDAADVTIPFPQRDLSGHVALDGGPGDAGAV